MIANITLDAKNRLSKSSFGRFSDKLRAALFILFASVAPIVSFGPADAQDYELAAPGTEEADVATHKTNDRVTLFKNVRIFDGKSPQLSGSMNLLVEGDIIRRITNEPIATGKYAKVVVIDGGSRVLMPGLIDVHWHAFMAAASMSILMTAQPSYVHLLAAHQAEATLMRGFTTVRDLGGPVFGLKRAIDEGIAIGPRIYPSGAFISQTSGHGDFRFSFELPRTLGGPLSYSEREGIAAIADSPDEVRLRAREQLRKGASQIKLMGGGGVSSPYNPIESTQYTVPELRAAVEAADNWGTYVTVHAYTPRAIRQAISAGVKCIEHGQLIDDATAKLLADKGIWWSMQPLTYDADVFSRMSPVSQKKALQVFAGTENAYRLAKKYNVKTAWGTDILFDAGAASRQGSYLAMMARWYTPAEALKMATADNGELMALSGFINPYPGKLGVVQEGALADLLLVDGDPLENLDLVKDPHKNFVVIMKDGKIYKNMLIGTGSQPRNR
ncbi:amidohydrolase family protein [Hyphomicrobium sp.]|jgi:imidazolonepropionase-like amidohydrolase|uniref:metal-dependent hydrolase family protein n=1 Tax=Hyphomicrobium sp. TaxID=82 RepID=UPI002BAAAD2C|nr:amidohydrolase family protein [Hyphomicrobium sp.]HVZ04061.1 amidohydrolase family protein [Hyphomicrobium sp.]